MNRRVFLVSSLTVLVAVEAGAHRHRPRDAVRTFSAEWNNGNVEGAANLFEEEGTLFVPQASYARGRGQVKDLLANVFKRDGGKLELGEELNYREFWHLATLEMSVTLSRGDQTQSMILSAVVVQTTDGPGQVDCQAGRACDEWSFSALWMLESRPPAAQSK